MDEERGRWMERQRGMNGWMDGERRGWMDRERGDGWIDEQINGQITYFENHRSTAQLYPGEGKKVLLPCDSTAAAPKCALYSAD